MTVPERRAGTLAALQAWADQDLRHRAERARRVAAAWHAGVRDIDELARAAGVDDPAVIRADLAAAGADPAPPSRLDGGVMPDDATLSTVVLDHVEVLLAMLTPLMSQRGPDGQPALTVRMLWAVTKLLQGAAGGYRYDHLADDTAAAAQRWRDVGDDASRVLTLALAAAGELLTAADAASRLHEEEIDALDAGDAAVAFSVRVDLLPPDFSHTNRTLTVTVGGDPGRALAVTADRGPAPVPRPHTATTLLTLSHALRLLSAAVGPLVLEPTEDGVPLCGQPGRTVTCEVCDAVVSADVARLVVEPKGRIGPATVCSVACARVATAGAAR